MITSINNIHAKSYLGAITFKAYDEKSHDVDSKNVYNWCDHQTSFFRNWETLEFTKDYTLVEFPQGTHIAGFGGSIGEEALSELMYLHEHNKDRKYTYTSYDVAPKVVELAKSGPYVLKLDLITPPNPWEENKKLRKLFNSCFKRVPKSLFTSLDDEQKARLEESLQRTTDLQQLIRLRAFKEISQRKRDYPEKSTYIPRPGFIDGVLDFKVGDIHDIAQILKPDGKTGVVIFKNAWYMLMGVVMPFDMRTVRASKGFAAAEKIIEDVHKILPKNGIFVVGNLEADHLYDGVNGSDHLIYQNGNRIKVCDNTPFHQLLRKHGFVPIFYEHIKGVREIPDRMMVALPSVWKKV